MTDKIYSKAVQLLGFCVFITAFFNYYADRKGIEYSELLNSNIKMYKDSNGVPNIEADSIQDAYFALGFAHAEDRLWAMYFSQKVALGELSELVGEKGLIIDRFARVLNFRDICHNSIKFLDQKELQIAESYSNGVNHYINTTAFYKLPFEFWLFRVSPSMINWSIESSCLVGKLIEYYLTFDFFQETMRTYLLEDLNISKDVIDKVFPFKFEAFEYQRTIIKEEEMRDLKYDLIVKTMEDIKKTNTGKKPKKDVEDVIEDKDIIENQDFSTAANKATDSIDLNDEENSNLNNQQIQQEEDSEYEYELKDTLRKEKGMGSNNFVISGKLTENGHPYVVNDPHLQTAMPAFWYFANIKVGNEYHFTGATTAGVPLIFIGTNSHLAWAITNGLVDLADVLRVEKSDVNENLEITLDGETRKLLTKRSEKFYLDTSKTKFIEHSFLDSEYGPVINGHVDSLGAALGVLHRGNEVMNEKKYYYILRSTFSNKYDMNLKGMINMPFSKTIQELREGLSYLSISLNIVFCDNKDNIGYQLTGKIPKKPTIESGAYIKTVTSWEDLAIETIPFYELPNVVNPEKGYIVTSNNIVVDRSYKHLLQGGYIMDARARALEDELESWTKSGKKVSPKFIMDRMLGNVYDSYCKDILKLVENILVNEHFNIKSSAEISDLLNFDCYMKGDSRIALIYNVFENEIHHILHYTETKDDTIKQKALVNLIEGEERSNYLVYKLKTYASSETNHICKQEYNTTCGQFIIKAYQEALTTITKRLGADEANWKWENLNVKHYPHKPLSMIPGLNLLAHRTVKSDGNHRTPKVSIPRFYHKDFKAKVSSNLKFLINLNNKDEELYFSIDSGQNGRLFHRHYDDMQLNHEKGKLIKFNPNFEKEKITLEINSTKSKSKSRA